MGMNGFPTLLVCLTPWTFTPLRGVYTSSAWMGDARTQRVSEGEAHAHAPVALEIRLVPTPPARGRREPALAPPTAAASPSSALGSSCEDPRGAVRGCTGFISPCDPSGRSPTPQRSPQASGIQLRAETRSATRSNRGRRWGGLPGGGVLRAPPWRRRFARRATSLRCAARRRVRAGMLSRGCERVSRAERSEAPTASAPPGPAL